MIHTVVAWSIAAILGMILCAYCPSLRALDPVTLSLLVATSGRQAPNGVRIEAQQRDIPLLLRPLNVTGITSEASTYKTGILSTVAVGACDQGGGQVLRVGLGSPSGMAQEQSGNTYILAMSHNEEPKISSSGTVTVIAGTGCERDSGDGVPGSKAILNSPGARCR